MKFGALNIAVLLLVLSVIAFDAEAQKKRKTTPTPSPKTTAAVVEIKQGAEKTAIQLKNVSKFVYLLGGIATGFEDIEKEIRSGRARRELIDTHNRNKENVMASIRALRLGLSQLESDYRTKPGLRSYLPQIQGITETCGAAEEQATGGQYTNAGKTLLLVIEKLADTLAALP
jgi:hypothetical protein